MREDFLEETVTTEEIDKAKKKMLIVRIISYVFITIAVFFYFLVFISPDAALLIFSLISGSSFLACGIYLKIRKERYVLDFDYTFISGSLRIAKVFNGKKRKPVLAIDDKDIETVGKIGSEEYNKISANKSLKPVICTPNLNDEGRLFYVYGAVNGEKKLIILQCSEKMIVLLVKYAGKRIMDKELTKQNN